MQDMTKPVAKKPAPPHIFDRTLLQRRRRRAALSNQKCDFLLKRAQGDLIDRLNLVNRSFDQTMVLGSHGGTLSHDIIATGKTKVCISADACAHFAQPQPAVDLIMDEEILALKPECLDLIVSPLTLQWVNDLPGSLAQIRTSLKPDGLFMAAIIGGESLTELRTAFMEAEIEMTGGTTPRVAPFADLRSLGNLMQRAGFALPVIDRDIVEVRYSSVTGLLADLRDMGSTNVLCARSRDTLTRSFLEKVSGIYNKKFSDDDGRIRATFEIIHISGWAPHPDQQQPLKPGSAKIRLSDALGVEEKSLPASPRDDQE